jgi:hypothetical protein
VASEKKRAKRVQLPSFGQRSLPHLRRHADIESGFVCLSEADAISLILERPAVVIHRSRQTEHTSDIEAGCGSRAVHVLHTERGQFVGEVRECGRPQFATGMFEVRPRASPVAGAEVVEARRPRVLSSRQSTGMRRYARICLPSGTLAVNTRYSIGFIGRPRTRCGVP